MRGIKRGDIYTVALGREGVGSEQTGDRPCLIIQNDKGNRFSPTTIIAIITSRQTKARIPTHIRLPDDCGLPLSSIVELEQIRTVDKRRLQKYIGHIDLIEVDNAIKISLGVSDNAYNT